MGKVWKFKKMAGHDGGTLGSWELFFLFVKEVKIVVVVVVPRLG